MRDNEMMSHRGVAADDPRNAGPIEFFRRKPVTRESLRGTLTAILGDKDPADVESRIKTMQTIVRANVGFVLKLALVRIVVNCRWACISASRLGVQWPLSLAVLLMKESFSRRVGAALGECKR
jgi:hypothetical protein